MPSGFLCGSGNQGGRHSPCSCSTTARRQIALAPLLTVYMRIKLHLDMQENKSSVVAKGPFFPQV
jgi:hypothetical protein